MAEHEIIESYRHRAKEDLKAAQEMLRSKFHLAAISRAYYAIFYAITAALLEKDVIVHRHKQLGIEFRRHFIKAKLLPKQSSQILETLFQARQTADYDAMPEITLERVQELIVDAEKLIKAIFSLSKI